MPGLLLHVGALVQCFHAAPVTTPPTQTRLLVSGQPVATAANLFTVAGCPFTLPTVPPKPQPCVRVQWNMLSTKVLAGGQPVVLGPGPGPGAGICLSVEQIPQGVPNISQIQLRVSGI
jgi:hypothetical protein